MANQCNVHNVIQTENIRDELSDEVIGLDLSKVRHFFTESAWLLINEKGNQWR